MRSSRRIFVHVLAALPVAARSAWGQRCGDPQALASEAQRMRDSAVAHGDQAYGAVVVMDGCIVGYGPSRVVQDGNDDAHAERVALWDAQKRLGRMDLTGAVIFSTSMPCMTCQPALAAAGVARMYVGPTAIDRGPPSKG